MLRALPATDARKPPNGKEAVTKYVVLHARPDGASPSTATATWVVLKMVDVVSARAAVGAAVRASNLKEGSFIAVPIRSWKQVKVEAEQTVRLKFS